MNTQNDQMAAAALRLLEDPVQRVLELKRVMAAHPTLTQTGLVWHLPGGQASSNREYRHRMPEGDVELEEYERQRDELRHESLTLEECILANGPEPGSPRAAAQSTPGSLGVRRGCARHHGIEHQGQIPLALFYLTHCLESPTGNADSYKVKHRAEKMGPPYYVSNGAMIAAAGMAGVRVVQAEVEGRPIKDADLYVKEPGRCLRTNGHGQCGRLLPVTSSSRVCGDCLQDQDPKHSAASSRRTC